MLQISSSSIRLNEEKKWKEGKMKWWETTAVVEENQSAEFSLVLRPVLVSPPILAVLRCLYIKYCI